MQTAYSLTVNKYLLFAVLCFFFNSLGLPEGLLYTTLLAPFLYVWAARHGQRNMLRNFLLLLAPFAIIHFAGGVDGNSYLISTILLFSVFIYVRAAHTFFKWYDRLEYIFFRILILNFVLTLIALILIFTPVSEWMWFRTNLTGNFREFPRLSLFTYEASYYSTLLVPLVGFFGLKLVLGKTQNPRWLILLMAGLPLILSFSLGILSCLIIATAILLLMNRRQLLLKRSVANLITAVAILMIISFLFLLVFLPENVLFQRLINILEGKDLSAKGRLTEAYFFATRFATEKNIWFGIGIGQIKIFGEEVIRNYYNYHIGDIPVVRIPNAFAETIATFGILGAAGRLILEIYLFIKTRVFNNYFRTLLFFTIFVYQFTGSFLTNVAEYTIWALAFCSCFPQFDRPAKEMEAL
ncbi:MAG: hypothetical protein WD077_10725 [Bacteroidia bacterium]